MPSSVIRSRRTRVALDGATLCSHCGRRTSKQWATARSRTRFVCVECEATRRAAGRCPFDDGSPGELHAFCAHQRRCAVCDGGAFALCEPCNLARGDGEAVASLVEERQIDVLFCDFDRTLCTTKSGASPLQSKQTVPARTDRDLVL